MNPQNADNQPRILIVDDNAAIHSDFKKILGEQPGSRAHLDDVERALFGGEEGAVERGSGFRIDSAYQGQEALEMVKKALQENDPYVMAFVDVRMPPGWDGVETLGHLWECCPELQAVICTAYSDYSWDDMTRRLAQTDNLLILKKPFDTIEALQIAHALTRKWALGRQAKLRMEDLDRMVQERTQKLQQEMEERTRMQEALRVSEERFSKAFAASPMPMAIQSCVDGRFVDANSAFLQLTGYAAGELLQRTVDELKLWEAPSPDAFGRGAEGLSAPASAPNDGAAHGLPEGRVRNYARGLRRHDASTRDVLLWTEPITLGTSPCLLVLMEDVSERLKLEAQLRQAQKMEAVGCLAAGIAHEFNNLLTVIQGHAGLLKSKPDPRFAAESVERISQASRRAASLTQRLLAFSRKQPVQLEAVNLSRAVHGLQKMLGQLIGERHQLELDCADGLPATRADEGNIEQVLINLVLNARDAMAEGGKIRLTTSLEVVDEATARENLDARPGQFVCLTVADSGCGMTREVQERIFDPFYTTKEIGKGTGLGLSTVHAIVQQHHGWVEVDSRVGGGSRFKVLLPVLTEEAAEAPKSDGGESAGAEAGAGEAVLVVEDEPVVRATMRLALEQAGYQVFEAADGQEAMAVWERCPVRINVLVTDVVMPNNVSGHGLARALSSRDPQLRTIYSTGYSSEAVVEGVTLTPGVNFLPKPYDSATLVKAIGRCLEQPAAQRPAAQQPAAQQPAAHPEAKTNLVPCG